MTTPSPTEAANDPAPPPADTAVPALSQSKSVPPTVVDLTTGGTSKPGDMDPAALYQAAQHTRHESMEPSPLKTAGKDRALATAIPANDNPALSRDWTPTGKPANEVQHMLACALAKHAQTWHQDIVGIDSLVYHLSVSTLQKLCYEDGAFNAWINE